MHIVVIFRKWQILQKMLKLGKDVKSWRVSVICCQFTGLMYSSILHIITNETIVAVFVVHYSAETCNYQVDCLFIICQQ